MQTLGKPSCEVPANYGKRLWQQRCKGGYLCRNCCSCGDRPDTALEAIRPTDGVTKIGKARARFLTSSRVSFAFRSTPFL